MPTTERVPPDDPDVAAFVRALVDELFVRYGDDPDELAPTDDGAAWLLMRDDHGSAIGCGAVQPLRTSLPGAPEDHGEIKRVFLAPQHRGHGHARPLMDALLVLAGELGYSYLQLETGTEQPEAVGLYERSGWTRVPNYGQYVDDPRSLCFGLVVPR